MSNQLRPYRYEQTDLVRWWGKLALPTTSPGEPPDGTPSGSQARFMSAVTRAVAGYLVSHKFNQDQRRLASGHGS